MTPRFYCPDLTANAQPGQSLPLGGEDTRHARKVLRLTIGDPVILLNGEGILAEATLSDTAADSVVCTVQSISPAPRRRPMLVIATAIPKGPRAEAMVDQLAQLGVDCLIPLQADHGVVKPGDHKLTRFEKIAITAMKQSVSPWLMRIDAPATLDQVLENRPKRCLILDPGGRPVLPVDGDKVEDMDELILLIGPEGGWSERELAAAEVAGVGRWKISDAVLRIETAAVVAAGLARYLTGTQQEPSRG